MNLSKSLNMLMASAVSVSIAVSPSGITPAFAQTAPAAEAPGDSGWQKEFEYWRQVNKGGEQADYQGYLRLYPRGKFAVVAKQRIDELSGAIQTITVSETTAAVTKDVPKETAEADSVKDLELWRQVSKSGKQADYEKYLKQFPKGKFAKVAKTRIEALTAKAGETPAATPDSTTAEVAEAPAEAEEKADVAETPAVSEEKPATETAETPAASDWEQEYAVWKAASDGNTVAEYESYLKAYPKGKFAAIAQSRVVQLSAAEEPSPTIAEGDETKDDAATDTATEQAETDQANENDQADTANADQPADDQPADDQAANDQATDDQATDDQATDDQASADEPSASQSKETADTASDTSGKTSAKAQESFTEGDEASENAVLDRGTRVEVQGRLSSLGYDTRGADGAFGPRTRDAIASWQEDNGAPVTGYLSDDQVTAIFTMSAATYAGWLASRKPVTVRRVRPRSELVVVRPRRQNVVVVKRRPSVVLVRPALGVVKFKNRFKINRGKIKNCKKKRRC